MVDLNSEKFEKLKKKTFGGLIKLGDVDLYKQNSA
jgi:hypothetical protein